MHERHRVPGLDRRRFDPATFNNVVGAVTGSTAALRREVAGHSAEGRELNLVTFGNGATDVLLWSQLHGDEPTGSMILADLMHFLATSPAAASFADTLTISMLPMINPDGVERFVRTNAQGLDPNRDARVWATPEARTLRTVWERTRPGFAIDLHDQDPRKRVGDTDRLIAFSVLAPKGTEDDEASDTRVPSMQLACVAHDAMQPLVEGHLSRYPATFEARGCEEFMQARGTSVLLLEAAGWRGDTEKQFLRTVGFAAVVATLMAIASRSFEQIDADRYDAIPENGDPVHDLLLRGAQIVRGGIEPYHADIAIDFDAPLDRKGGSITEVGDLADQRAIEALDARGLFVHAGNGAEKGAAANLELRDAGGTVRYRIEDGRLVT